MVRPHRGGAVIAYAAPRDVMLACVEVSEWAAASASAVVAGNPQTDLEPRRAEIAGMLQSARNTRLLELFAEAERRALPILWDDEITSLGHGARSVEYPTAALPLVSAIPWDTLGGVPIALVTGTNGKTTSSRLLAHVAKAAGFVVGSTSTDGVVLDGEVVERGDWTGPIAARLVLRDPRVTLAVLETARGGILRRGLAITTCDAALITNIAADHLNDYGIDDLDAMARAKLVAAQIVKADGTVALNARDPYLMAHRSTVHANVTLFADLEIADGLAETQRVLAEHRGSVVVARDGRIFIDDAPLMRIDEAPITFGGAARYNVENVLGVVATARGLGIAADAIARGLRSFAMSDNPGRGQLLDRNGVKILLDFGHNPDGVRAVMQLVRALRTQAPGLLVVIAASPGDRSDSDIEGVVREIASLRPNHLIVRELTGYLRGRELGAVPAIYERVFAELGFPGEIYELAENEVAGLRRALALTGPGDLVVMLVHMDQDEVREFLA
jgi:UDP-N-acetylmuramyl tripeptide synthase